MNLLEMQHVKKDFGENEVLKDISLIKYALYIDNQHMLATVFSGNY